MTTPKEKNQPTRRTSETEADSPLLVTIERPRNAKCYYTVVWRPLSAEETFSSNGAASSEPCATLTGVLYGVHTVHFPGFTSHAEACAAARKKAALFAASDDRPIYLRTQWTGQLKTELSSGLAQERRYMVPPPAGTDERVNPDQLGADGWTARTAERMLQFNPDADAWITAIRDVQRMTAENDGTFDGRIAYDVFEQVARAGGSELGEVPFPEVPGHGALAGGLDAVATWLEMSRESGGAAIEPAAKPVPPTYFVTIEYSTAEKVYYPWAWVDDLFRPQGDSGLLRPVARFPTGFSREGSAQGAAHVLADTLNRGSSVRFWANPPEPREYSGPAPMAFHVARCDLPGAETPATPAKAARPEPASADINWGAFAASLRGAEDLMGALAEAGVTLEPKPEPVSSEAPVLEKPVAAEASPEKSTAAPGKRGMTSCWASGLPAEFDLTEIGTFPDASDACSTDPVQPSAKISTAPEPSKSEPGDGPVQVDDLSPMELCALVIAADLLQAYARPSFWAEALEQAETLGAAFAGIFYRRIVEGLNRGHQNPVLTRVLAETPLPVCGQVVKELRSGRAQVWFEQGPATGSFPVEARWTGTVWTIQRK